MRVNGILRRSGGWTLLEASVVLAVIAVILAAGLSANDLLFSARSLNVATSFVEPWIGSYRSYRATGRLPGDHPTVPTGLINAAVGVPLCNEAPGGAVTHNLSNQFLAIGVKLPEVHQRPQRPDILIYTDSDGIPHSATLCLVSQQKSELGSSVGSYVLTPRAAILIRSLHWSVAQSIDRTLDQSLSSRFGRVRSMTLAGSLASPAPGSDCWFGPICIGGADTTGFVDLAVFVD